MLRQERQQFGDDHPRLAPILNKYAHAVNVRAKAHACACSIGEVYRQQSKFAESMDYYRRSLAIRLRVHGPDHPIVADIKNK